MFRFTIRDVLWLTVVVAICCGWWLEHRRFVAYHDRMTIKFNFRFAPVTGGVSHVGGAEGSNQDTARSRSRLPVTGKNT